MASVVVTYIAATKRTAFQAVGRGFEPRLPLFVYQRFSRINIGESKCFTKNIRERWGATANDYNAKMAQNGKKWHLDLWQTIDGAAQVFLGIVMIAGFGQVGRRLIH